MVSFAYNPLGRKKKSGLLVGLLVVWVALAAMGTYLLMRQAPPVVGILSASNVMAESTIMQHTSKSRGNQPADVAITPDGARLYVPCHATNNALVIDTANNKIINVIDLSAASPIGAMPFAAAITPNGEKVYVANFVGSIAVIDTSTNEVTTFIDVDDGASSLAITPDGKFAYVGTRSNRVFVIDINRDEVSNVIILDDWVEIHEVKVSHDGSKVFLVNIDVTQWLMADIYIVDTATNTVIDIIEVETKGIGPRPMLAVDPDDNKIYLTSGQNEGMYVDPDRGVNRLFIIDIPSRSVVNEIKITGGPVGIRLSSDGKFAYISTFIGKVVTVDLNQAAIVSEFPWNVYPANLKVGDLRDLVISPDGNRIYITAWDGDAIAIAEPAVGRITQVIDLNKIRTRPFEITISPDGRAYVSNYAFAEGSCPSIKVIDTSSHSIVGEISLEFNSRGLAVTPDGKFRDG